MTRLMCLIRTAMAFLLLSAGPHLYSQDAAAKLKLPSVLSDHMVVQRDVPFRVWGWAKPGDTIKVTLGKATGSTQSGTDGKWLVKLEKLPASATPADMTVTAGTDTITIKDILVGDVWVCSGQSNMALNLGGCKNIDAELAQANRPEMRFFQVKGEFAEKPKEDCSGQWALCTPATAKAFSAVGYYFGRDILLSQKVPVGLIGSNQGASFAQVWLSLDALNADPELKKSYIDPVSSVFSDPEGAKAIHDKWLAEGGAQYDKDRAQWYMDRYAAVQKKEPFDRPMPKPPQPEPLYFNSMTRFPTVLFNARIHPLVNFPIRGALWYQGESNAGDPLYQQLMTALIKDWRTRWQVGDFPFLIVQLPNKSKQQKDPQDPNAGWAAVREKQQKVAQTVPNTGLAVAIDVGSTEDPDENNNLHPSEKENLGSRLALAARHLAYGENLIYSGPLVAGSKIVGNKIQVTFTHTGSGLKIGTPPKTSLTPRPPTDELKGFAIAGMDKKFVAAKATLEGPDSILVWSDSVAEPAFVRYGWQMSPVVNLYNSADLPASPFRTDTD